MNTTALNFRKSKTTRPPSMWIARADGFKFLIQGFEIADPPMYEVRVYDGENTWKFEKIIRKSWINEDYFASLDAAKDHLAEVHAHLLDERS